MDAGSAVDGLLLVLDALFYLLKRLVFYLLYILHFLASPLLYLGHVLLSISLFPLRLLAKFEVFIHTFLPNESILEAYIITGNFLFHDWSGAHRSHCWSGALLYG